MAVHSSLEDLGNSVACGYDSTAKIVALKLMHQIRSTNRMETHRSGRKNTLAHSLVDEAADSAQYRPQTRLQQGLCMASGCGLPPHTYTQMPGPPIT